jgi:type I restriction enzyme S subunit
VSNYQLSINNYQLPEGYKQTEVGVIPEDSTLGIMGEVVTQVRSASSQCTWERSIFTNYRTSMSLMGKLIIEDVKNSNETDDRSAQFEHFMILNGDVLLNEGQTLELVGRSAPYIKMSILNHAQCKTCAQNNARSQLPYPT